MAADSVMPSANAVLAAVPASVPVASMAKPFSVVRKTPAAS